MVPDCTDFINIDVVYLNYNSQRDPLRPLIQFEGNCLSGLYDLQNHYQEKYNQRHLMGPIAFKHFKWYQSILEEELSEAPSGYKLQIFHWSIESGICEAFQKNNNFFDAVTMIIGPNMEYWYGANISKSLVKRGRYPRIQSDYRAEPSYRYSYLPQSSIIVTSCNLTVNNCNCLLQASSELIEFDSETMIQTNNSLDEDDAVLNQDIILFKISMKKFKRSTTDKYSKCNNKCTITKLNIRLRTWMLTIIEEIE